MQGITAREDTGIQPSPGQLLSRAAHTLLGGGAGEMKCVVQTKSVSEQPLMLEIRSGRNNAQQIYTEGAIRLLYDHSLLILVARSKPNTPTFCASDKHELKFVCYRSMW